MPVSMTRSRPSALTALSLSARTISQSPHATVSRSLSAIDEFLSVGVPAAEMHFRAPHDLIEHDGHGGKHGDQAEQPGGVEILREQRGEMTDAGGRDIKFCQQYAEQDPGHAKPHAREEARDHMRKDNVAQHLPSARAHRARASEQDRLDVLDARDD